MFRTLFFIFALAIGLSILMRIVISIARSVQGILGMTSDPAQSGSKAAAGEAPPRSGHFVRDPESGTYIDQSLAVKATIDGQIFYFESEKTRDAYLKKARA